MKLAVYNILGEEVTVLVDERKSPGEYRVVWNAVSMPSGIYFARLEANGFVATKKMMLVK